MSEFTVITSPEHLTQLAALLQQMSQVAAELSRSIARVPKDQAWYWTPEWQAKEREADEAMKRGDHKEFDNVEDLIAGLHALV